MQQMEHACVDKADKVIVNLITVGVRCCGLFGSDTYRFGFDSKLMAKDLEGY